jgi:hypothetical protein
MDFAHDRAHDINCRCARAFVGPTPLYPRSLPTSYQVGRAGSGWIEWGHPMGACGTASCKNQSAQDDLCEVIEGFFADDDALPRGADDCGIAADRS